MSKRSDLLMNTDYAIHVCNRGVNREMIFRNETDYERFLLILWESLAKSRLSLFAYVLLPNHFHLIAQQQTPCAVSEFMKRLSFTYAISSNKKWHRTGHLLQGRYRIKEVDAPPSLLRLSRYVHLNPVSAGLAAGPEKWRFSSYRQYCADTGSEHINLKPILSLVGGSEGYRRFMREYDPSDPFSAESFILPTPRR
jgi:REP element-mobilizing transposase RayT